MSVCSCEYDWRETVPEIVPENELALSRQVCLLCGLLPIRAVSTERADKNPLYGLGLRDLAVTTTFIAGLYGSISWATGVPTKSIEWPNKDLHKLYTSATLIFEDWPRNFHRFLEKQSIGENKGGSYYGKLETALKREFYSFYKGLYKKMQDDQYKFMRESFAEFLTIRWEPGSAQPIDQRSASSSNKSAKYISINAARRLLKLNHQSTFELIRAGEIRSVIRNNGLTLQHVVRLADVEKVKSTFEQSMSLRELAKERAIDCGVVKELAHVGYLQTKRRRTVGDYHAMKFDRNTAEKLLNRVSSRMIKARAPSLNETLNFTNACMLCGSLKITVTVTDFVRALVDGEVRPCADIPRSGL